MCNKLDDLSFIKMFKSSLNNLSNVDDKFCKKVLIKNGMSALKKSIYVKGMKKWKYITTEHNFDDKLCLTVLSLMYPTIAFYCYSPINFDSFI